jgi:hypothetical protein
MNRVFLEQTTISFLLSALLTAIPTRDTFHHTLFVSSLVIIKFTGKPLCSVTKEEQVHDLRCPFIVSYLITTMIFLSLWETLLQNTQGK